MTFFAGLIIGILCGALSWVAAAAWLELKRTQHERRDHAGDAAPARIAEFRQQHSNA